MENRSGVFRGGYHVLAARCRHWMYWARRIAHTRLDRTVNYAVREDAVIRGLFWRSTHHRTGKPRRITLADQLERFRLPVDIAAQGLP